VDAESVGLENALRVIRAHPETSEVGIRVDSGDIAEQCVLYFQAMRKAGIQPRMIVFEDEVTPEIVHQVYEHFRQATGEEPTMLFPGAGGYWWRLVLRDTVAAAFKRSATGDHPNVKFSNSPGKESIGGYLRVYGRGDTLVIADASEKIDGEPLFVKLVEQGRIVYRESFEEQAARADRTWGRYARVTMSATIEGYQRRFQAMREREVAAARGRLGK
jgi:nicotinic acid phosphoribosyltransferase